MAGFRIDLATAVRLRRRAEAAPVLLFHEHRTPARRRARIDRLRRWMGGWLWSHAGEYVDGAPPPRGRRRYGRHRPRPGHGPAPAIRASAKAEARP